MQIEKLQNLTQIVQRTNEWYQFRHNLITASNIWKAIGSEANQNSLILEKCKPMGSESSYESVNTDSPLHWGSSTNRSPSCFMNTEIGAKWANLDASSTPHIHSLVHPPTESWFPKSRVHTGECWKLKTWFQER